MGAAVRLSAAPSLPGSADSLSARRGRPSAGKAASPTVTVGGRADGDRVSDGLWADAGVRRCLREGVTCCHSLRSGTPNSETARGSGDDGGGETFGAGFVILGRVEGEKKQIRERDGEFLTLLHTSFSCAQVTVPPKVMHLPRPAPCITPASRLCNQPSLTQESRKGSSGGDGLPPRALLGAESSPLPRLKQESRFHTVSRTSQIP